MNRGAHVAANGCPKYGGAICKDEAGALCECYPGLQSKQDARSAARPQEFVLELLVVTEAKDAATAETFGQRMSDLLLRQTTGARSLVDDGPIVHNVILADVRRADDAVT